MATFCFKIPVGLLQILRVVGGPCFALRPSSRGLHNGPHQLDASIFFFKQNCLINGIQNEEFPQVARGALCIPVLRPVPNCGRFQQGVKRAPRSKDPRAPTPLSLPRFLTLRQIPYFLSFYALNGLLCTQVNSCTGLCPSTFCLLIEGQPSLSCGAVFFPLSSPPWPSHLYVTNPITYCS